MISIGCCDDASGALNPTKLADMYNAGKKKAKDVPSQNWDAVIWLGDFNSRTEGFKYFDKGSGSIKGARESTLKGLEKSHYHGLFNQDQLNRDILKSNNDFFNPFKEGHPSAFSTTFKIKAGMEKIKFGIAKECYTCKRLPSYTDRILFWSNQITRRQQFELNIDEKN